MDIISIDKKDFGDFLSPLLEIPEPPEIIYFRGKIPEKAGVKTLAVVGSRRHSMYGKEVCERLVHELRGLPIIIVSGLALGIDSVAHEAALKSGITTVAVPGSGLLDKVLYPSIHKPLARHILDAGGTLISEFEPDTEAAPWTFPKRNRIMAGLADAVLIIEAEEKSGTQITARLALDFNRDVFSVPGNITSPNSSGTNRLIKLGATPILSPEDLLSELGFEKKEQGKSFDPAQFSEKEQSVLAHLREPLHKDELISLIGMPAAEALTIITALEIRGIIKEEFGMMRILL